VIEKSRIKICGLTREQDAQLAVDLGAWALGFILFKESPRYVSLSHGERILRAVNSKDALKVGVFVDSKIDDVVSVFRTLELDAVQLHGFESVEYCEELRMQLPKSKIFKAFRPRLDDDLNRMKLYKTVDGVIIDSLHEKLLGGTGQLSRWDLAKKATAFVPVILSGGLNPENIASAKAEVSPFAFDLSSGVESSPGIKSEEKMRRLFNMVGNN
jgi:phosphoribosylanthranilate isomerase